MDIKEASTRLNISETTVRRWIKSGRLQATMIEGPYGPQYDIPEEALDRARRMENVPVLIHDGNPIITQEDITKAIQAAISENVALEMAKVEEGILQEIDSLKSELESTRKALAIGLEERDKKLIEVMRATLERQKEEYEQRERERSLPWWRRLLNK